MRIAIAGLLSLMLCGCSVPEHHPTVSISPEAIGAAQGVADSEILRNCSIDDKSSANCPAAFREAYRIIYEYKDAFDNAKYQ